VAAQVLLTVAAAVQVVTEVQSLANLLVVARQQNLPLLYPLV
jgi:hypothetical protein